MEHFVIIVNGWKPLTIITKNSILDVAAVLDPPLTTDVKESWLLVTEIEEILDLNNLGRSDGLESVFSRLDRF